MDAGGRHQIPGSETKYFAAHSTAGSIAISMFAVVLSALQVSWGWYRGPGLDGCLHVQRGAVQERNPELRELPGLCRKGRYHPIPENVLGDEWSRLAF